MPTNSYDFASALIMCNLTTLVLLFRFRTLCFLKLKSNNINNWLSYQAFESVFIKGGLYDLYCWWKWGPW